MALPKWYQTSFLLYWLFGDPFGVIWPYKPYLEAMTNPTQMTYNGSINNWHNKKFVGPFLYSDSLF
jgi:hypothetical protein